MLRSELASNKLWKTLRPKKKTKNPPSQNPPGKKTPKTDEADPAKDAAKEEKEKLDTGLNFLKLLKTRFDAVLGMCNEIYHNEKHIPSWDWSASWVLKLKAAQEPLEKEKRQNDFWMDWSMNPGFTLAAKKKYTVQRLHKEFKQGEAMAKDVAVLEALVAKVRGMVES